MSIKNISFIFLLCMAYIANGAHIIFDLGGVLLNPDKYAIAMKAGPLTLGVYAVSHMESPREAFYNILYSIQPFTETQIKVYDENGKQLPNIICDWLKGIPSKKILGRIQNKITENHTFWPLAHAIFEPTFMARTQCIIEEGKNFVQECIEQGHCVYILSNWDTESFNHLSKLYPEFFGLFSGIIISGDCHLLKPDIRIFTHFLLEYNLKPEDCFFIDNQAENVATASSIGITGTVVKTKKGNPNFKKVRIDLTAWSKKKLQYA